MVSELVGHDRFCGKVPARIVARRHEQVLIGAVTGERVLAAELLHLVQRREEDLNGRDFGTVDEAPEEVGPALRAGVVDRIRVGDVDRDRLAGRGGEGPAPRGNRREPPRGARGEDGITDQTGGDSELGQPRALEFSRSRRRGAGS